jgi:hypothetical protein
MQAPSSEPRQRPRGNPQTKGTPHYGGQGIHPGQQLAYKGKVVVVDNTHISDCSGVLLPHGIVLRGLENGWAAFTEVFQLSVIVLQL